MLLQSFFAKLCFIITTMMEEMDDKVFSRLNIVLGGVFHQFSSVIDHWLAPLYWVVDKTQNMTFWDEIFMNNSPPLFNWRKKFEFKIQNGTTIYNMSNTEIVFSNISISWRTLQTWIVLLQIIMHHYGIMWNWWLHDMLFVYSGTQWQSRSIVEKMDVTCISVLFNLSGIDSWTRKTCYLERPYLCWSENWWNCTDETCFTYLVCPSSHTS